MFVNCLCGPAIGRSGGWLFAYQGLGTSDTLPVIDGPNLGFRLQSVWKRYTFFGLQVRMPDPKAWQAPHFGSMQLGTGNSFRALWCPLDLPRMNGKAMTQHAQPEQNSESLRALLSQACRAKCCDLSLSVAGNITCFFFLRAMLIRFVLLLCRVCWASACSRAGNFCFELRSVASMPRFCRWRGTEPFRNAAAWWHKDFEPSGVMKLFDIWKCPIDPTPGWIWGRVFSRHYYILQESDRLSTNHVNGSLQVVPTSLGGSFRT